MKQNEIFAYLSNHLNFMRITPEKHLLEYSKFECNFYVIVLKSSISCFLKMNTINDQARYTWQYACEPLAVGSTVEQFCSPLLELADELKHLAYAWEGQPHKYSNGKYIKGSLVYGLPVYDGNTNYDQRADANCMPIMSYILSLGYDGDEF